MFLSLSVLFWKVRHRLGLTRVISWSGSWNYGRHSSTSVLDLKRFGRMLSNTRHLTRFFCQQSYGCSEVQHAAAVNHFPSFICVWDDRRRKMLLKAEWVLGTLSALSPFSSTDPVPSDRWNRLIWKRNVLDIFPHSFPADLCWLQWRVFFSFPLHYPLQSVFVLFFWRISVLTVKAVNVGVHSLSTEIWFL